MRLAILALAAFALAGCVTPCPPSPTAVAETNVRFACEDGSALAVTFIRQPDSARIVQQGYPTVTLPSRSTGSGYRYSEEGVELRGRGVEARWSRPGAAETLCQEILGS